MMHKVCVYSYLQIHIKNSSIYINEPLIAVCYIKYVKNKNFPYIYIYIFVIM